MTGACESRRANDASAARRRGLRERTSKGARRAPRLARSAGRRLRGATCGAIGASMLVVAATAGAQTTPMRGIAFEESLSGPAVLAAAIPNGGLRDQVPLAVLLSVDPAAFDESAGAGALERLGGRLELYRARKIPVIVVLGALPSGEAAMETWRRRVRRVADRHRGAVAAYQFQASPEGNPLADAVTAFHIKQAAILIRSVDPDAAVALGPLPEPAAGGLAGLYGEGIAPYVDAVAIADAFDPAAAAAVLDRHDPAAALWSGPMRVSGPGSSSEGIITTTLRQLGTRVSLVAFSASPPAIAAAVTSAQRLADVLAGPLLALDEPRIKWTTAAGQEVPVRGRMLYSAANGDTYLIYEGRPAGTVELETDTSMTTPAIRDPLTGAVDRLTVPPRERSRPARLSVRLADRPLILDFNYGQASYAVQVETRQTSLPPVEEIIARHQQRQAAQDLALRTYTGRLRIEMRIRPSPADPAYHIVTDNQVFAEGTAVEWVENSFSVNGATWTSDRPSFPLVQPEKVLSLPLDLRLTQDYRYRLLGVDDVNGRDAFAVRFDPVATSQALYRGTVWIDRATFARLKVSAVQTGAGGVVQSNEEEQVFGRVGDVEGTAVWLPIHLVSRQTLLIAGRTILNERDVRLTNVRLNAPDFDVLRSAARAGDRIMYRDTPAGVRYLVKRGDARTVSEELTTNVRALALGATFDPSFDVPLPMVGLNLLDFNFLDRDLQLAMLFGGVIGAGNVQRAGLLRGRLDASVDFFYLALKGTDAVFDAAGERTGERVRSRPASVGLNAGYRLSPAHKITARLEVRRDSYSADERTDAAFIVPSSTTTTGQGVGYEYRRRGYSLLAAAAAYRRSVWAPWGGTRDFDPAQKTYLRYEVGLSRDFVFGVLHTVHLNGQYLGGRRLDRFSQYQFGMFDSARMHGVPCAVRFGELAMFRGSYSFNLLNLYRVDLFLDHAVGRVVEERPWQQVTGVGVNVNLRGPRSTILRGDVGRSWLPGDYRGAGSMVAQFLVLKPL